MPLLDWKLEDGSTLSREELDAIAYSVKTAAYKVIEGKGATNFAIGLSGARIVEAILNDEHAILPISSVLNNYHGVSGIAMSVPTLVSRNGAVRTIDISMEPHEQELFEKSAAAIKASLDSIGI